MEQLRGDDLLSIMKQYNLSYGYVVNMINEIIHNPFDVNFQKRYAISLLVSPTIAKVYNENGIVQIKKYLNQAKEGNLEEALSKLGITMDAKGIEKLIKNMKEYEDGIIER